jgi:DNA invertase Pin-like site-specific DNA recombinase
VLAQALPDLRAGHADALAVAESDRLSRSVQDLAGLLNHSKEEGWAVTCLDLGIDASTSNGRMMPRIPARRWRHASSRCTTRA